MHLKLNSGSPGFPCWNDFSELHIEILLHSIQNGDKREWVWATFRSRLAGSSRRESVERHKFKHLYFWNWKRCRDENEKLSPFLVPKDEKWKYDGSQSADWSALISAWFFVFITPLMSDVWSGLGRNGRGLVKIRVIRWLAAGGLIVVCQPVPKWT